MTSGPPPGAPQPTATASSGPRPPAGPRRLRTALAATALAVAVAAVAFAVLWRPGSRPSVTRADVAGIAEERVGAAIRDLRQLPPPGVEVYNQILPPLVIIEVAGGREGGLGTGVVVSDEGTILTALHVVEGVPSIEITFSDGTRSPAAIESTDPEHDIAVLAPRQLPSIVVPATLGGGASVGDEAFAVGHPLGLVGSLSAGVISGLDRSFKDPSGRKLKGLIQFDAAVNPGSSGGPLLNRAGQVIGIVTALANPGGGTGEAFTGVGFAVPIATASGPSGPGK